MAFATVDDVITRLQRDPLPDERANITALLEGATAVIAAYVGKAESEFTNVPELVKMAAVSIVVRALANPTALSSRTTTLGAYTESESFGRDLASELTLTKGEELVLRRAVWGTNTGSSQQDVTLLDDMNEQLLDVEIP